MCIYSKVCKQASPPPLNLFSFAAPCRAKTWPYIINLPTAAVSRLEVGGSHA